MRESMYVFFSVLVTCLVSCSREVIDHASLSAKPADIVTAKHINVSDNDKEDLNKCGFSEFPISNVVVYTDELGRPTYLIYMQQEIGDNEYQDKVVALHVIGDSLIEPEFINLSDTDSIYIKSVDADV